MSLYLLMLKTLGPILTLRVSYFKKHRRFLSLKNPKYFSEKIFYRRLFPKSIFEVLSDKVQVRKYVQDKIGEKYLIPLIGVYDNLTLDIWEKLPDSFIIKTNHGAGFNHIVYKKNDEDFSLIKKTVTKWLSIDYSEVFYEKHYQKIKPKIVIEKLLVKKGIDLWDYKVHVFSDPIEKKTTCYLQIISGRISSNQKRIILDEQLRISKFQEINHKLFNPIFTESQKQNLFKIINLSKKLSSQIYYCRNDFYLLENQIYFGEMTFTPGGGNILFTPREWDKRLGHLFKWPEPDYNITNL